MAYRLAFAAGWLAIPFLLGAQAAQPSLELVSIRRAGGAANGARPSLNVLPGGRFEARNQTIENLVRVAFGFEDGDSGSGTVETGTTTTGVGVVRFALFDITAVADREWISQPPPEKVPPELRTILRQLLETRFKLKTRIETKKRSVAALRLAGVEPGPGLRSARATCLGPFNRDPAAALAMPSCPYRFDARGIEAGSVTMPEVASLLLKVDDLVNNTVIVDDTGLTGRWNMTLEFFDASSPRRMLGDASSGGISRDGLRPADPAEELSGRSAKRAALAKQLGLKIVQTKQSVRVLRILHAEAPPED
jgi:uncharacterized protein (TIGR03435 family)